jgi:hypothetical protein
MQLPKEPQELTTAKAPRIEVDCSFHNANHPLIEGRCISLDR